MRKDPSTTQKRRLLKKNAGVCCVCKHRGLGLHFHHIDGDNSNTVDENLAVLCVKDHDAHHRPHAYTEPKHLELGAEKIQEHKQSWEAFVEEASKPHPKVLAVLNVYGDYSQIHSVRLILQWENGKIEFERIHHLLTGPVESWIDSILEEIQWLGKKIPLVFVNEPLDIEYCPHCQGSLSNTVDEDRARRITAESWDRDSVCTIYVNPTFPSLAISIFLSRELLYSGHLHLCGSRYLHYQDGKFEERVPVQSKSNVRTQATRIVEKVLDDWEPGQVLIGTGDPDDPKLIPDFELPEIWEDREGFS